MGRHIYIYPMSTGNQINLPPPQPYPIPYVVSGGVKPDTSLLLFFFNKIWKKDCKA